MNITDNSDEPLRGIYGVVSRLTTDPVLLIIVVPLVSTIVWYISTYATSPLKKYPGPPLAAWSNYWRMYHAAGGSMHLVSKNLHDKYGPVVRMAPNYLDLDCPSLIKTCFDSKGVWRKTEWHGVSGVKVGPQIIYNIFSECDPANHSRIKKPVAKFFTPNAVLPFEQHVNTILDDFVRRLEEQFAGHGSDFGTSFDFGKWILFYTMDVVGQATWSKPVGYLEHGCDFDGTVNAIEKAMDYLVTVGMQPKLDVFFDKNPVHRVGPPSFLNLTNIALGHLIARYSAKDGHDPAKPDYMDRYIDAKQDYPDIVDDNRLLSYLLMNIAAGADTTAVSLRSIFYLCLKHEAVWKCLQKEILEASFTQRNTMVLPAPFSQARSLPYLEAVIREALRLYPGNCFPMERYVPAGGLTLADGSFVPEGVAIGFNAYVLHRNRDIWGSDAENFRPERWFRDEAGGESEDEFQKRLTRMNNCDLSFGAGSRRCIGKNLGMLEVYKTVATLVAMFEFELADPEREWTIHNSLFPRQSGVEMRIKRRHGMEVTVQ